MAINTALLVAAPVLQDVIVDDATGEPLANGTIALYQDNSRTTFKNWYYQSGAPGAYTYITLPNPLTLNAAGAIADPNGNDTIPFFYPFSEVDNVTPQPYYIQVFNSNGQQKFVRQNFPFNPEIPPAPESNASVKNYIVNNGFWRNSGSLITGGAGSVMASNPLYGLASTLLSTVIAPGANDGFSMPDYVYFKNGTGGTETVSFIKQKNGIFLSTANPSNQDVTPEYYVNVNCTAAGSENLRYIQIPIQVHLKNFESTQATFTIWAQNAGSNPNNQITIQLLQYLGTGVVSSAAGSLQPFILGNNWTKLVVNFTFPTIVAAVGNGGDDAWYIQIALPAGTGITCNVNLSKPSLYIGNNNNPGNDFTSYNETTPIIDGFRTGDIRQSLNSFQPYGWVPMNDGTICLSNPNTSPIVTRSNADTFQLFNLIWNLFKAYDTGSNFNPICQMYTSAATPTATNFGGSAYADFTANNQLSLTKMMGKILIGSVPQSQLLVATSAITGYTSGVTFSTSSGTLLVTTSSSNLLGVYKGGIVTFATGSGGTLPTGITANTLYYASPVSSTTFFVSTSFANAMAGTYIAWTNNGTPTNNAFCFPAGSFEGEYNHTQLLAELAAHNHTVTPIGNSDAGGGIHHIQQNAGNDNQTSTVFNTGTTGSSTPFNVVQPSTYMNFYIKL